MSEKDNISPDELFQQGLEGFEADFSPTDWDQMLDLLESDETPVPVAPVTGKKKQLFNRRITFIIMSILVTVTAAVLWIGSPTNTIDTTKTTMSEEHVWNTESNDKGTEPSKQSVRNSENKPNGDDGTNRVTDAGIGKSQTSTDESGDDINLTEPATDVPANFEDKPSGDDGRHKVKGAKTTGKEENATEDNGGSTEPQMSRSGNSENTPDGDDGTHTLERVKKTLTTGSEIVKDLNDLVGEPVLDNKGNSEDKPDEDDGKFKLSLPDTAGFYKRVVSRRWVDTTWKYEYLKHSRDIEDGWFGMYFTQQNLMDADEWEAIGRNSVNQGFNLQFMAGNLLPGENLAAFGGIDWGMQFLGRSKKHEVLINSVNEDRGVTFLRSHINDVMATGQIEWAQANVVPYVTGSFGTRIFTTAQTTRTLVPSSDYESSQEEGLHTRAALAAKYGVGARVKLNQHIYFDARYEAVVTKSLKVVDYNNTGFNGLDYDLGFKSMNLNSSQFRFGFVFDLSEEERRKVVDEPAHWEEQVQELYIDPKDSSKVFVPCPCSPCDEKKKRKSNNNNRSRGIDWPDTTPSPGNGGWNGGGGSKSNFPGLRTPKIPN